MDEITKEEGKCPYPPDVMGDIKHYYREEVWITEAGRREILARLDYYIAAYKGGGRGRLLLPDNFRWEFLTDEGKITKRIAKEVKELHDIKLEPTFVSLLGQFARDNAPESEHIFYDVTKCIDWKDGDFGDEGSCFWGSNAGAKMLIENNGGGAIRFWERGNRIWKGHSRCWLAPLDDDLWIIFNAYSRRSWNLIKMARIWAGIHGLDYRVIDLSNFGCTGDLLYINGSTGYMIGKSQVIKQYCSWDLQWKENAENCENCGRIFNLSELRRGPEDEYLCSICYGEEIFNCYDCGEDYYKDEMHEIANRYVCSDCADNNYSQCDICEEFHRNETMADSGGETLCQTCVREYYTYCSSCGELFRDEEITWTEQGLAHCKDCS